MSIYYVYAMRQYETGKTKIGITKDLLRRYKELITANSAPLMLDWCFFAPDKKAALHMERQLHGKFDDTWTIGEWFQLDSEDHKFMNCLQEFNHSALGAASPEVAKHEFDYVHDIKQWGEKIANDYWNRTASPKEKSDRNYYLRMMAADRRYKVRREYDARQENA